jgi:hypothetical protein
LGCAVEDFFTFETVSGNCTAAQQKFHLNGPGMELSIESTMLHPKRGFIKLEDTVAVNDIG